ncbi:shieldin complex subunit 2 isoform X2 [Tiliqua scincoides]|uniref:shieldin complex subunit 2 isoform X2 n=1 Tax=Tiliqua scincoides TaxID=71010 RepID=UPI0034624FDB
MSGAPQIHIFFGAPILSNSLKASKEEKFSTATSETWSKLHFSFTKDTFNLCTRKCMCPEQADHRTLNNVVLAAHSKDHCTTNLEKRCVLADVFLTDCADHGRSVKSFSDDAKGASELTENCCHVCRDTRTENKVKHFACQQLPTDVQTSEPHSKESEDVKGGITCMSHAHLGISALILSTKNRGLKSLEQDDKLSKSQHSCHKLINQYLEIHHPQITESKTEKPLDVCSSLAISANTEFLGILTSSQVALLSGRHAVDQNEMHNQSMKLREAELDDPYKEGKEVAVSLIQLNENDMTANLTEINCRQDYESSLELFDSDSIVKANCPTSQTTHVLEKAGVHTSLSHLHGDKSSNEAYTELWKKGILCSQGDNSPKRPRACEDTLHVANFAVAEQQQSKKARLICSPIYPLPQMEQLRISVFENVRKHLSLLKDCYCKDQKYSILVTVLHPCHIKEIHIKPGTKMSSKVPLATVVVFDQSEIRQKIMLWRSTAFWSLTVFPGDIVLITDVIIYENRWVGEKMLQSTYTSRLLNLGSFSAINQNEFSHLVDVNILQDLLIYVSSKHNYLQALPKRQPQTLNNIQYVLLDQLKPDTLVHSIVKIVNITELTESTYSYKGEKQRKIILIIEQVKDQHYALVLWGAAAAYSPNLQKKRDHIWEFKYLFAKHNPVSGELELHTTPWTTFECLFEDDRRAVAFKERFKKSVKSLMRGTSLAAHLEEKCSGCAKCGLELQTDENKIYEQCSSCLPSNKVKMFYRPALMTVEDDGCEISVRVVSELMEKMFLNIPADWLNKTIEPSLDTTYGMIVAELCHSLVTDVKASYLLEIKSHFVLDENSYPLEKDFHLLGFHLDL